MTNHSEKSVNAVLSKSEVESEEIASEGTESEVLDAIKRSVSHDEIVTLTANSDGQRTAWLAVLERYADDSVLNGPVVEHWGTDEDGDAWRVHVATEVQVDSMEPR